MIGLPEIATWKHCVVVCINCTITTLSSLRVQHNSVSYRGQTETTAGTGTRIGFRNLPEAIDARVAFFDASGVNTCRSRSLQFLPAFPPRRTKNSDFPARVHLRSWYLAVSPNSWLTTPRTRDELHVLLTISHGLSQPLSVLTRNKIFRGSTNWWPGSQTFLWQPVDIHQANILVVGCLSPVCCRPFKFQGSSQSRG